MPLALSTLYSVVSVAYTRLVSSCFLVPNQFNCIENKGPVPSLVLKTCNLSTQRAKAGESQVQSYPGLHGEFRPAWIIPSSLACGFFFPSKGKTNKQTKLRASHNCGVVFLTPAHFWGSTVGVNWDCLGIIETKGTWCQLPIKKTKPDDSGMERRWLVDRASALVEVRFQSSLVQRLENMFVE